MSTTIGPCGECYNCVCLHYHMLFKSKCCDSTMNTGRFIDGKPASDDEVQKRLQAVKAKHTSEKAADKAEKRWNQIQFRDVCNNCGNKCEYNIIHK